MGWAVEGRTKNAVLDAVAGTSERRMIMNEVKNYPPYWDYPKPHKPQTNADLFRAMSNEEQQDFVRKFWEIEDFADWLKHAVK